MKIQGKILSYKKQYAQKLDKKLKRLEILVFTKIFAPCLALDLLNVKTHNEDNKHDIFL